MAERHGAVRYCAAPTIRSLLPGEGVLRPEPGTRLGRAWSCQAPPRMSHLGRSGDSRACLSAVTARLTRTEIAQSPGRRVETPTTSRATGHHCRCARAPPEPGPGLVHERAGALDVCSD